MARKLDRKTVRWMAIVITFFTIVTLVVTITLWLTNGNWDKKQTAGMSVTLTQDGIAKETLSIEALSLRPGSKVQSEATITCEASGNFTFLISFSETEDSPLKEFIQVVVKVGEDLLGEYSLAELLGGQTMDFTRTVEMGKSFVLSLLYKMPLDVDDTAQGLEAKFTVNIEAGNA